MKKTAYFFALAVITRVASASSVYTVTALSSAPNSTLESVNAASSFGAAGDAYIGVYSPPQMNIQPAVWQGSTVALLPVPDGFQGGVVALNNLGDAAGSVWSSNVNAAQPAVWHNGQLTMLSTLDMPTGNASAVNDQGAVVGMVNDLFATPAQAKAVMWADGQTTVLGNFPGAFAFARAINNQGQVVVVSAASTETQTWVWQAGALTQVTSLGGAALGGAAINDLGHITGTASTGDGTDVGFFWSNGVTAALPNLLGDTYASGEAINNLDQIVGSGGGPSSSHALLWQNGQVVNLNDLISADSGWYLLDATGIADNGTIAGNGYFNGAPASFLLTPSASPTGSSSVPEPASASTLGVAGLLLLRRRRRA